MSALNSKQKEAVDHKNGPLLLIAGAGAGKTRVITERIANLIEVGVEPRNILAVTFTNKAAREMGERVENILEDRGIQKNNEVFVSTFHSLGVFILKEFGKPLGLSRWFTIYDRDDSKRVIKQILKDKGHDPKEFDPGKILNVISREKGKITTAQSYANKSGNQFWPKLVSGIWTEYEKRLEKAKALDFDDLLLKTVILLSEFENVRKILQERYKYIHIDEYQDTNAVQYGLSKLLAESHNNICVVGDMDQNIYSWRGANIENLRKFEKDFKNTTTILLEENYRSTQNILTAANEIIKKNKNRKDKNLFTKRKEGELIYVFEAFDERDEAKFVAEKIKELKKEGVSPDEIAVLYRANFQSRIFEEVFLQEGIPYHLLGTRFFDRREVKELLAFVRAALNGDDWESVKRIINIPKRGIGAKTLDKIYAGQEAELPMKMQEKLSNFRQKMALLRDKLLGVKTSEGIKFVIEKSGLKDHLLSEIDGEERLENVKELVTIATKYDNFSPEEGIEKLITEASLVSDQDTLEGSERGVRLMTVHAAKGLEFKYVFVVGLEQDLFPHSKLDSSSETEEARAEEERRLFYVALTRAQEKIFLSGAGTRMIFGSRQTCVPSEFISDISPELIEESLARDFSGELGRGNLLGDVIEFD